MIPETILATTGIIEVCLFAVWLGGPVHTKERHHEQPTTRNPNLPPSQAKHGRGEQATRVASDTHAHIRDAQPGSRCFGAGD